MAEALDKTCPVCKDNMNICAVGVCDHAVCYVCSTRLRVVCEQSTCSICRTEMPQVFYLRQCCPFASLKATSNFLRDSKYGIFFESESIQLKFIQLLENRCSQCRDIKPFNNFKALCDHMRKEHNLHHCDICQQHLKLFSSERKFYTREDLGKHRRVGDENDQAYRGHPLCKFCDRRYLDPDELARHLRKEHYFCQFCDADGRDSNVVFGDYSYLRLHFLQEHYLCEEGECALVHFTNAFRSEIDLKAHTIASHGKSLRRTEAKQVRTIEVDYGSVRQTSRGDRLRTADARPRGPRYQEGDSRPNYGHGRKQNPKSYESEDVDMYRAVKQSMTASYEQHQSRPREEASEGAVGSTPASAAQQAGRTGSTGDISRPSLRPPVDWLAENSGNLSDGASASVSVKPPAGTMTRTQTEPSMQSMAKRLAIGSGHSVADGHTSGDEFPSLVSNTSSSRLAANAPASSKVRVIVGGEQWSPRRVEEDFPSLPPKNLSKGGSQMRKGGNAWTANAQPVKSQWGNHDERSASSQGAAEASGGGARDKVAQGKSKADQGRNNSKAQSEKTKEAPTLVRLDKEQKSKSASASGSAATTRSVDSGTSTSASVTSEQSGKSKMLQETSLNSRPLSNNDNEASSKTKQKPVKENNLTKVQSSRGSDFNDEFLLSADGLKDDNVSKSKAKKDKKKLAANKAQTSVATNVSENGVSSAKDAKSAGATDNPFAALFTGPAVTVSLNDPTIAPPSKPASAAVVPPPGFALTSVPTLTSSLFPPRLPPGLGPPPPPGLSLPQQQTSQQVAPVSANSSKSVLANDNNFTYVAPAKADERNRVLISKIQGCGQEKFGEFKTLSGKYRRGDVDASAYYENCKRLLGDELFSSVFSELLALLPDIERQGALLAVHRRSTSGRKAAKGGGAWQTVSTTNDIVTCGVCSQVLASHDIDSHRASHRKDMDFPPLAVRVA